MGTIGVGLIGTGYMGKCHALAWTGVQAVFGDTPVVRRAMLCEVEEGLARRRADEFGFEASTADWRALIADPAVDVVSITTPNALHAPMAIAALEAGKHVWCEKPMAPTLADSERMAAAARASGRVAILGYNYIQSPAVRFIGKLLRDGAIGRLNHFRIEMDEDYLADAEAPFSWRSAGQRRLWRPRRFRRPPVEPDLDPDRPPKRGLRRNEQALPRPSRRRRTPGGRDLRHRDRAPEDGGRRRRATIQVNRCAWGRKGRLQLQLFGVRGAITFDQERFNEVGLYVAEGPAELQGFRQILMGPAHPPYDQFIVAPGHQMGFNDLKIIEAHELLNRIAGEPALTIDFEAGLVIERTIHAIARSSREGRWIGMDEA